MEPKTDAGDQGQPSLRATDEAGEVIARDVLHHLPASARDRPVRQHQSDAEDEVARRAEAMPKRPGQVSGEERSDGRVARRIERQPLAVFAQGVLERRQAKTRLDRARQVAGLVLENPVELLGGQIVTDLELPAVAVGSGQQL